MTKLKYLDNDIAVMCIKCELVTIIRKRANMRVSKTTDRQEITLCS